MVRVKGLVAIFITRQDKGFVSSPLAHPGTYQ